MQNRVSPGTGYNWNHSFPVQIWRLKRNLFAGVQKQKIGKLKWGAHKIMNWNVNHIVVPTVMRIYNVYCAVLELERTETMVEKIINMNFVIYNGQSFWMNQNCLLTILYTSTYRCLGQTVRNIWGSFYAWKRYLCGVNDYWGYIQMVTIPPSKKVAFKQENQATIRCHITVCNTNSNHYDRNA